MTDQFSSLIPSYCFTESVANPARLQQQRPNQYHRSPNKRRKASRDRKAAGISIYIRCVCPGYIRAYVCSCFQTFRTKPKSSFRPGYVAKAGIWDFRRSRSLPSVVLPRLFSVVSCRLVTAPGMNPAERHEKRRRRRWRRTRTREPTNQTPCRVRKSGRAVLAGELLPPFIHG